MCSFQRGKKLLGTLPELSLEPFLEQTSPGDLNFAQFLLGAQVSGGLHGPLTDFVNVVLERVQGLQEEFLVDLIMPEFLELLIFALRKERSRNFLVLPHLRNDPYLHVFEERRAPFLTHSLQQLLRQRVQVHAAVAEVHFVNQYRREALLEFVQVDLLNTVHEHTQVVLHHQFLVQDEALVQFSQRIPLPSVDLLYASESLRDLFLLLSAHLLVESREKALQSVFGQFSFQSSKEEFACSQEVCG